MCEFIVMCMESQFDYSKCTMSLQQQRAIEDLFTSSGKYAKLETSWLQNTTGVPINTMYYVKTLNCNYVLLCIVPLIYEYQGGGLRMFHFVSRFILLSKKG